MKPNFSEIRDRLQFVGHARDSYDLARFPDFFVIGPQRTGTTWLYRQLSLHPEVFIPTQKEIRYFNNLEYPEYHPASLPPVDRELGWYLDYFEVPDDVRAERQQQAQEMFGRDFTPKFLGEATASYGAALQYFTGSKAHNVAIRSIAAHAGLKVNEYGVFKGSERIAGRTEKDVYARLGLPYIEPELRENRGEIEAAAAGRLPRLVTLRQIRGDLHCHTNARDGRMSLRALAKAAQSRGYAYVAVTDHTQHAAVAHGLDARRLRKQLAAIDRLNDALEGIVLLKGAEVDILEDGSLDLPDDVLEALDITVGAIHDGFDLPRGKQTERIMRAMDHRCFNILAHPTGRLLGEREPYDVDLQRIMEAARERGCFLELNAQPSRLDLSDTYCKLAKESGVKLAVSTDAHRGADLNLMELGITQARRGWLEKDDVVNTRKWKDLRKLLKRK